MRDVIDAILKATFTIVIGVLVISGGFSLLLQLP
jgi:hypothetical protein